MNDQFKGDWEGYLKAIEQSNPTVEALGITDYAVLNGYKEFRKHWKKGRASNVKFIFPNIEFRLTVQTESLKGINLHLIFSPDDPDHESKIEHALSYLKFNYRDTEYSCIPNRLIELGRSFDPSQSSDAGALKMGVEQFKLDVKDLVKMLRDDAWARENCLVGLVTGETDGTGGLQKDGAFKAISEELKSMAQVIFSSHFSDRQFWLGEKKNFSRNDVEKTYRCLKPCIHGSDAHKVSDVLKPADDRYCWIRADLSFSGLKQILIEPGLRVSIGSKPPLGPSSNECISTLDVSGAPWLKTNPISLNEGLVAIIGPKGSGKTALADMIAHCAGGSIEGGSSFLLKAKEYLSNAKASLLWGNGETGDAQALSNAGKKDPRFSEIRYLSQQFVDRLCGSEKLQDELLAEIEAVVFLAVDQEKRLGAISFEELKNLMLDQVVREKRIKLAEIEDLSTEIAQEEENRAKLPKEEEALKKLDERIKAMEDETKGLLPKAKSKEGDDLIAVQRVLDGKISELESCNKQLAKLDELALEFSSLRSQIENSFDKLKARFELCGIGVDEWIAFSPQFATDARRTAAITGIRSRIKGSIKKIENGSTDATGKNYSKWPLKNLREYQVKLSQGIGVEKERTKKHVELLKRLGGLRGDREKLSNSLTLLRNSDSRRAKAIQARRRAYSLVFQMLTQEQDVLSKLHQPLTSQLADQEDAEKKLEFYVQRHVDTERWVARGESLLDLRKGGTFHGHGNLEKLVKEELEDAWSSGDAAKVAKAMEVFIGKYMKELVDTKSSNASFVDLGRWLFSTDHVTLEFGIRYDGVDIHRLSPGMRGIVLLMLYLKVDRWDTRPLLIDQPEENLDPHSVYNDLVKYFRNAKRRRQVILVTHNPNLVVNADADQVIVALSDRRNPNSIPNISYISGGLEDKEIRTEVCRVLEGGERAFLDRERRYSLPRDPRVGE